jgi:hypothetical protein
MRYRTLALLVVSLALVVPSFAWAQGGGGGGGGGRGGAGGGFGGGGMLGGLLGGVLGPYATFVQGQDALSVYMASLADMNMAPDFPLTKEQKEKIQAIRDKFKADIEKWNTDHADDSKKLRDDLMGMIQGGNITAQDFQDLNKKRTDMNATAPSADDAVKEVKAVLGDDLAKQVDDFIAAQKADRNKKLADLRTQLGIGAGMGGGFSGGRGGAGGGGGNNPAPGN